ncbi:MAG: hypothetical protein NVSMB25_21000 [Thermoleophilaceae bacterium]
MAASAPQTWILTGSLDNFRVTSERGFRVIGMKERRRALAEQIEVGDRIIFYVTKIQAFAGMIGVTGELYEDRSPIWPVLPSKPDAYPWRFETEPILTLPEDAFVSAETLAGQLEHVRKWPAAHWHLAFQGQLRRISGSDATVIERALREPVRLDTATA